jgi:hypothetical protein
LITDLFSFNELTGKLVPHPHVPAHWDRYGDPPERGRAYDSALAEPRIRVQVLKATRPPINRSWLHELELEVAQSTGIGARSARAQDTIATDADLEDAFLMRLDDEADRNERLDAAYAALKGKDHKEVK